MERTLPYFKKAFIGLIGLIALAVAHQALAAGTLTIEQQSIVKMTGDWTLDHPDGISQTRSKSGRASQDIKLPASGSYTLTVEPPSSAKTSIELFENGVQVVRRSGNKITIDLLKEVTYRLIIEYKYDGIISVDSEPRGVPFNLEAPNRANFSGVTPALFTDLPTQYFIVHYTDIEGCSPPKPQRRVSDKTVEFFGRYDCTVREPELEPELPEDIANDGRVEVRVFASPQEAIPGDSVRYTIEVKNFDRHTQGNLAVSFSYDPKLQTIVKTLPKGGTVTHGGMSVWEIEQLFAGRTWSATFPVEVKEGTEPGTTMEATARISGNDVEVSNSIIRDTVTVGAAVLPAAGGRFDILFLVMAIFLAATATAFVTLGSLRIAIRNA